MIRLLLLSLLFCYYTGAAQYSYRGTEQSSSAGRAYDSSVNFPDLDCSFDPKSLVGQEVYFAMQNPDRKLFNEGDLLYDSFMGEKGTYKEVAFYSYKRTPYGALANRTFLVTNCSIDAFTDQNSYCMFHFTLKDPEGKEVKWSFNKANLRSSSAHNVPTDGVHTKAYLELMKKRWANKQLYASMGDSIPYTCSELTFVFDKESYFGHPRLVLKRDGTEQLIPPGKMDGFMTEQQYRERKEAETLKQEAIAAQDKQAAAEAAQQRKQSRDSYIKQFGKVYGAAIADGEVKLGMTPEMCTIAWGEPDNSSSSKVSGKMLDTWLYHGGGVLSFTNGKLTRITK